MNVSLSVTRLKVKIARSQRAARLAAGVRGDLPFRHVANLREGISSGNTWQIPPIVWSTWIQNSYGRRHAAGINRFRAMNPEYAFRVVDDAECLAFIEREYSTEPIADLYRRARFGPLRSDIWRYLVILKYGGWYFDIKSCLHVPIHSVVQPSDTLVISLERVTPDEKPSEVDYPTPDGEPRPVVNWAFGATPGHPVLRLLIANIVREAESFQGRSSSVPKSAIIELTGPRAFGRAVRSYVEEQGDDGISVKGVEFGSAGCYEMKGSWTRLLARPSYSTARDEQLFKPTVN